MSEPEDPFVRLARESGRLLGELGVRPADDEWIRLHAGTIADLAGRARPRRGLYETLARWARRAARAAR